MTEHVIERSNVTLDLDPPDAIQDGDIVHAVLQPKVPNAKI